MAIGTRLKEPHGHLDDSTNTALIPLKYQPITGPGSLHSIQLSIRRDNSPVYIQLWRPVHHVSEYGFDKEYYKLVSHVELLLPAVYNSRPSTINLSDAENIGTGLYRYEDASEANRIHENSSMSGTNDDGIVDDAVPRDVVSTSTTRVVQSKIKVEEGDVVGLFFPDDNPIPYSVKECYSRDEQFRYLETLSGVPAVGEVYEFLVAPLAWNPCRDYDLKIFVGK